jgi:katanin p60 ATPase-containing subunit A1
MSELAALKSLSKAKEGEEKRLQERRRNVLVLMLRHLADHGYADTYERLCAESNLNLQKV